MIQHESLRQVYDKLIERNLGEAISALEIFLSVHPHQINSDRLFAIRSDYQLMADYWRRGYKDPRLAELYDNLLRRMYTLFANISIEHTVRHSPYLSNLYLHSHMQVRDWSPAVIKEEMESFVSDIALLELEPPHTAAVRRRELYSRHQKEVTDLFYYILTMGLWTDGFATGMEEIMLSPTIDNNDQRMLISSVMLSAMNCFDIAKFRVLVDVYLHALDEQVRQRALVGWVFSLQAEAGRKLFPEEIRLVGEVLEDEARCHELVELQKQIVFCINAERDNATIQKEIMPDLLKHQGIRVTRNGIEEEEEDSMRDILHPDEAERDLEALEANFQRMKDMQQQGSDIYYGGFSQMKGFDFFKELANWFVPFFYDHPGISQAAAKFKGNRLLDMMLGKGPFCDSDQYSFLLAFERVLNQIPQKYREMMEREELALNGLSEDDRQQPAYIRRVYLQDLYRFYRIFQQRDLFKNVFDIQRYDYLFFASPLFSSTQLELHFNEIVAFLIKRGHYRDAVFVLNNYGEYRKDFQYYMMAGYLGQSPVESYSRALELQPDNERALAGYARALFAEDRYEEALDVYDRLLIAQPEKRGYQLNKSICLTNLQRYDESQKLLFRLNYEDPDDVNTTRVLAWTLTCNGKYEQAERLYSQLLSEGRPSSEDLLNYGYCLWFSGGVDEAADCFHRYLKETGHDKEFVIVKEQELILAKGITEPEIQLMLYVL